MYTITEEIKNENNHTESRTNRALTDDCKSKTQLVQFNSSNNINQKPSNKSVFDNKVTDYADGAPEIEIDYASNQYNSVWNIPTNQKDISKSEIPTYQKPTYSIQRKMRSKVETSPSMSEKFSCNLTSKIPKIHTNLLTERAKPKEVAFDFKEWEMNWTAIDDNINQFSEIYSIDCQTDFDPGIDEHKRNEDIHNEYDGVFWYLDRISPMRLRRNKILL